MTAVQRAILQQYRAASGEPTKGPDELALDASRLGRWRLDFVEETLTVSHRFKEMLGFERGGEGWDANWDDLFSLIHPGDVERVQNELEMHLDGLWPFDVECRFVGRFDERWIRLNGQAEVSADGVLQMAGTIEDVSATRKLERDLRASEERFRSVFEASPEAMLITRADGTVVLRNAVFDGFAPAEQPIGLSERVKTAIAEEGRYGPVSDWLIRRDGQRIRVELSGIELDADRVLHVVRSHRAAIEGLRDVRDAIDAIITRGQRLTVVLARSRVASLSRLSEALATPRTLAKIAEDHVRREAFSELVQLLATDLEEQRASIGEHVAELQALLRDLRERAAPCTRDRGDHPTESIHREGKA